MTRRAYGREYEREAAQLATTRGVQPLIPKNQRRKLSYSSRVGCGHRPLSGRCDVAAFLFLARLSAEALVSFRINAGQIGTIERSSVGGSSCPKAGKAGTVGRTPPGR